MNSDLALLYLLDELLLLSLWFLAYPCSLVSPIFGKCLNHCTDQAVSHKQVVSQVTAGKSSVFGLPPCTGHHPCPTFHSGLFAFWVVNEPVPKPHVPTSCLGPTVMPTATASLLVFPGVETKMGSGVQKKGRGEETGVSWGESADHDANLIPVRRVQERRRFRGNFRPKNGSYKVSARLRRMAEERQSVRRALCWLPLLC